MMSANFECQVCGSPAVTLPKPLNDAALVLCGGCRAEIGTWLTFKTNVSAAIDPSAGVVSADPLANWMPFAAELHAAAQIISKPLTARFGAYDRRIEG
jgi:hypothetical protein